MPENDKTPLVSIALLVKDGMPELGELLDVLGKQDWEGEIEIVAIDSGSSDGSLEALARSRARIEEMSPEGFRFGPARQACFASTSGDVVITLSQDAVPSGREFVRHMASQILDDRLDIVVGLDEFLPEVCSYWERKRQHYATNPYEEWSEPWASVSCHCLAISREAWRLTGFGDVSMSEDKFLANAAREKGLRAGFTETAVVKHTHHYDLKGLVKRCFNEGMGARYTGGRYPFSRMFRQLIRLNMYRWVVSAWLKGAIRTPAEVLFPFVRPMFLWAGYRFGRVYWR